jgi:ATP-dependent DNA helicase DinG
VSGENGATAGRGARVLELAEATAELIRREIARARGNEVCFVASVDSEGRIVEARVVARGHDRAVLAAARDLPPGGIILHNHPSGELTPSDADLHVAGELYSQGIGMAIVDNRAQDLYVVVEPLRPDALELLDVAAVTQLLAPGGPVSAAHAGYEDRPSQRDMAREVAETYNDGGLLLVEAGTGTGKSIAYLVPAILWAVHNRERTVVSTNTINLQEQLVSKDLPFLRRALGLAFRFALVKGRNNYVSIRRARLAAMSAPALLDDPGRKEIDAILDWTQSTREGSLQDLPFTPSEEVWDEVVSDSDVCLRTRCPHFEACFYQRARRDAATADVLVVNHHLLFSDVAVRRAQENYGASAVLPPYRRLILDEAHNLEEAATSHLGVGLTRRSVLRLLNRVDRRGRGLLLAVEQRLAAGKRDLLQEEALAFIADVLRPRVERAKELAGDFFAQLEALCARAEDGVLRLGDDFTGDPQWARGPAPALESLLLLLDELARGVAKLSERINIDEGWKRSLQEQLVEMQGVQQRLLETATGLRTALQPGRDNLPLVRWLERRGVSAAREPNVAVRAAPIELADALRESLFERIDTVVLTSATLTTRDGFNFIRSRLGLGPGLRVTESTHVSPFDFESQTAVAVVTDMPTPREEGDARLDAATAAATEDLARLTDGGLFVLFTSYRALRAVAAELRRRGAEGRWPLFVQGEAPRARLLARFVDSGRGVLLGVSSFWEGVDVPGDPLRGLLIARLPFKVPTEPLTAARLEAIENNGGNSFLDYMLPLAALRLKQGFGRLIRSRSDRGAVIILDPRARERGYGRYLLDSLAPAPFISGPWAELREAMRAFYLRGAAAAADSSLDLAAGNGGATTPEPASA